MAQKVTIIKKSKFPFDAPFALLDASNTSKLFTLHLARCDDAQAAQKISDTFLFLGKLFAKKSVEITAKVL